MLLEYLFQKYVFSFQKWYKKKSFQKNKVLETLKIWEIFSSSFNTCMNFFEEDSLTLWPDCNFCSVIKKKLCLQCKVFNQTLNRLMFSFWFHIVFFEISVRVCVLYDDSTYVNRTCSIIVHWIIQNARENVWNQVNLDIKKRR